MPFSDYSRSTQAARVGTELDTAYHSMGTPIYMTNNYLFENVQDGADRCYLAENGDCYTRISNPTNNELGRAVAELEGAEMGLPFATGIAGISALALTVLEAGDHVLVDNTTYSATNYLFNTLLAKFGVETSSLDFTNLDAVKAALRPNTRLVFFETPCNPTLKVIDIEAICKEAHTVGALAIVDNTFATPFLTRPLALGADVVMHSSTKYLCGHGDAMGGILVGAKELMVRVQEEGLKNLGGTASPFNSFLILRGIKTLELRMKHHCAMAAAVAKFLVAHPAVKEVYYPGLAQHPGHAIASKQMADYGGLLAFELVAGMEAGEALMNNLKLCALAVSLGEANTLVQHPSSMTHWYVDREERLKSGISDGLVRFSAGLESIDEVVEDLRQALAQL